MFSKMLLGDVIELHNMYVSGCVREIAKSDYQLRGVCPSVRPSFRLEQLGSHWTDFYLI